MNKEESANRIRPKECKVGRIAQAIKDNEGEKYYTALLRWFDDPSKSSRSISNILTRAKYSVGDESVTSHRNKTCRCFSSLL